MKIRGQKVYSPQERILRKVVKNKKSNCWEWQGATRGFGYGYLTSGSRTCGTRKTVSAHRYSYEAFISKIPKGLWVLHKCDNPKCVNPEHLFLGDMQANVDDRETKCRNKPYDFGSGENHPNAKLTWDDVNTIRSVDKYRGCVNDLSKKYGVNYKTISDIRNMKTWIPEPPEVK